MDKLRKFFTSVPGIILVFLLAAIPFLIGSIGSARAALTYYSDTYQSEMSMRNIGVTLRARENENLVRKISNRDYVGDGEWDENTGYLIDTEVLYGGDKTPLFGKKYPLKLSVSNSGSIDTYVRATVYKYWFTVGLDGTQVKDHTLSPDLIDISFLEGNGWHIDHDSSTTERTVLYYDKKLCCADCKDGGPVETTDFTDGFTINGDIQNNVLITNDGNGNIIATYRYNDYNYLIQVDIDAVQDHNAKAAIKSAWGWDVSVVNDTITKE